MGLVNLLMPWKKNPANHVVMEVSEITPNVFVGTNACCRVHYKLMLLDRGVSHDISLEGEQVDQPYGVDSYLWLPTPDHEAPTALHLALGTSYMKDVIRRGGKLYLHCKNGHGRAPTLAAAFLTTQGLTPEAAVDLIRSKRPETHLEQAQMDVLRAFVATK